MDIHVVSEGVHQQPLLDEPLPLWLLGLQVAVVVIGDDDAVGAEGQLDDVAVVVADHPLAIDAARWCEDQDISPFQLIEDVLVCHGTWVSGSGITRRYDATIVALQAREWKI